MRKVVVDAYVEGILSQEKEQGAASSEAGSQTEAAVLLELRFPYNLVGETQYGPNTRWSVDLGWEP